jgi:peptidase A4-like protein
VANQDSGYLSSVSAFPEPPHGFIPLYASDEDLSKHGFPPRPDGRLAPHVLAEWEKTFSRPLRRAQVELREIPGVRHGPNRPQGQPPRKGELITNALSSNWSGAVVVPTSRAPINLVVGWWTVPDVYPRQGFLNEYSSHWIGIDGWFSTDVLQVGSECDVSFFGGKSCYAWFEWFPAGSVYLFGFGVTPGDRLHASIVAISPTLGSVFLMNPATAHYVSFLLNAPSGTVLRGDSAEWIVERPEVNGNVQPLPHYGAVYFDSCFAGTPAMIDLGNAIPVTMMDGGTTLSVPTIETKGLLKTEG